VNYSKVNQYTAYLYIHPEAIMPACLIKHTPTSLTHHTQAHGSLSHQHSVLNCISAGSHTNTLCDWHLTEQEAKHTHTYINTPTPETNTLTLSQIITAPSTPQSEKTTLTLRYTDTGALTIINSWNNSIFLRFLS